MRMPNSGTHLIVGGVVGLSGMIFLKWVRNEKLTFWEGVGGVLAGCFGASLPDLLEPANSPSHRKVLHSMTIGGAGIPFSISRIYEGVWSLTQEEKDISIIFLLGYFSHLVLDGRTPKGLPMF
jgi:membrane-bound metal-dependent hydrolase YbcI (DUF457 family)